ncbi:MAG: GntR family transcriptional regulator [Chloroflexota bacterium]
MVLTGHKQRWQMGLGVQLDGSAARPLYLQLRDTLLRRIEAGEYAPHQRLPSERELSRAYRVSRITVRQALADLAQCGRVYTRVGKGTYVSDPSSRQPLGSLFGFSESVRRHGRVPSSSVLEAGLMRADEAIAARLQLAPGEEVVRLRRVRKADGVPIVVEATHLPHAVCPGLLHKIGNDVSLYAVLEESYGLRMVSAEVMLEAALADETEAAFLHVARPAAVLRMEQTSFSADGRPLEFTRSTYWGDGYRFNATLFRGGHPRWAAVTDEPRPGARAFGPLPEPAVGKEVHPA